MNTPSAQQPEPTVATVILRHHIRDIYRQDESACVEKLAKKASFSQTELEQILKKASPLVEAVRSSRLNSGGIDAFMNTYDLSSREGIVLMCLAEALLRIPDAETIDLLIRDKIGSADWEHRLGASHSLFVNASTWGLMLTGRFVSLEGDGHEPVGIFKRLITRVGEPVIRQAVATAMRIMGKQFVMGRTISEGLDRARGPEKDGYRHSYDMLGESARTDEDAKRYCDSYADAIDTIGRAAANLPALEAPSISIKLSALHARYEVAQEDRVFAELLPRVTALALRAKGYGIGFTIDAEEADRLEISLDIIEALALDPALAGWNGLGLAVQAYQKRALPVIDWLADLARRAQRRIMVRLVKGAYWDTEIKLAQERGLSGYPVFTRKINTDTSYIACARRLLADPVAFYPAFATHNAHTLAAIAVIAGNQVEWEYQRLHGMGEELYQEVVGPNKWNRPCRVYAPIGSHKDLLAYLVRRLLENGANTSFVSRIADADMPIAQLLTDPVGKAAGLAARQASAHNGIRLPSQLFGAERINSQGLDMFDKETLASLAAAIKTSKTTQYMAQPLINGVAQAGKTYDVVAPANRREVIGQCADADAAQADTAMKAAAAAFMRWTETPASTRAAALCRAADLMEKRLPEMIALVVREGGRTQADALSEVREAVDFLRYYAAQGVDKFSKAMVMPGPTGESNTLSLHGRGVFVCISPWNFPLAIFVGQVAAALAAGNTVVAKPAEQTPLCGAIAIALLHEAGIPGDVLHFLPGDGRVGAALVAHPRCGGVAFTGSTEVARLIAQTLVNKPGPIVPLIAETGGQNAMIADSSALPEQVVRDVLASAFNSAGQRCSALRVLFIQEDVADKVVHMLRGAMQELRIGNPELITTDVGPVIDTEARANLEKHVTSLNSYAKLIHRCEMNDVPPADLAKGTWFAPCAYEIDKLSRLQGEVFGPILHVIRWKSDELDRVCDDIAATGYGLTLGIHSRIDTTVKRITSRLHVGNTYVNRNTIGAVVGVQPFGGEGLSGTGPKAGGPHYLYRFASERTVSVDTTAAGGNASLMSMEEGN